MNALCLTQMHDNSTHHSYYAQKSPLKRKPETVQATRARRIVKMMKEMARRRRSSSCNSYQSLLNDETATFTKHKLYNFHIFYQSNRIYTWSIFEMPTGIFDQLVAIYGHLKAIYDSIVITDRIVCRLIMIIPLRNFKWRFIFVIITWNYNNLVSAKLLKCLARILNSRSV